MKKTGTWAVKSGLELLVPIPTIASAVFSRIASQDKDIRVKISKKLKLKSAGNALDKKDFINLAHASAYIAKISSYAQGFALMSVALKKI